MFPMLIVPDNTSSCSLTLTNFDSPVRELLSNLELPLIIIPSNGIFSPFLTIIVSPNLTSSGFTITCSLFLKTQA